MSEEKEEVRIKKEETPEERAARHREGLRRYMPHLFEIEQPPPPEPQP